MTHNDYIVFQGHVYNAPTKLALITAISIFSSYIILPISRIGIIYFNFPILDWSLHSLCDTSVDDLVDHLRNRDAISKNGR